MIAFMRLLTVICRICRSQASTTWPLCTLEILTNWTAMRRCGVTCVVWSRCVVWSLCECEWYPCIVFPLTYWSKLKWWPCHITVAEIKACFLLGMAQLRISFLLRGDIPPNQTLEYLKRLRFSGVGFGGISPRNTSWRTLTDCLVSFLLFS